MSIAIALSKPVIGYLAAINAAAIFIAPPLRIGAAPVRELRTLSHPGVIWLAWCHQLQDARQLIEPQLQLSDASAAVAAIQRRAETCGVSLTAHDTMLERAQLIERRVDASLLAFRAAGELQHFNRCYRAYRQTHERPRPYPYVLRELRAVTIQVVIEQQPAQVLTERLRQRFPWYCDQAT